MPPSRPGVSVIKVLHVSRAAFGQGFYLGGGERYVQLLAEAVRTADPDVEVAVVAFHDAPSRTLEHRGIRTTVLQAEGHPGGFFKRYAGALWPLVEACDLVHVHHPLTVTGQFAILLARQLGKAIVGTDTGGGELMIPAEQSPVAFVHRILAISEFATRFVRDLGAPVSVIIGPVGAEFLDAPLRTAGRDIDALFVGRLMPHKGVHHLIRAAPPDLRVTIAGRSLEPEYTAWLRSIAAGKSVTFVPEPSDDQLFDLYGRAKVHVAPSIEEDEWGNRYPRAELMGLTTLESLASGTPVLTARTGGLPELAGGTPFGRVYDGEAALAPLLLDVRDGVWPPDGVTPATCRAFAADHYGPRVVGGKLARLYADVLDHAHRP